MARSKLRRLLKVESLPNVFILKNGEIKVAVQNFFKNNELYTLEIGCGHGDYSVKLAQKFPQRNFIGLDLKGARIFKGANKCIELKLNNVAFILASAEKLNDIFPPKSFEEIYIPFPEPHVRRASEHKRLISTKFLEIYKPLMADSGMIHLKTDDQSLYEYALKIISDFGCCIHYSSENLYKENVNRVDSNIITSFENHYIRKGRNIKFISFKFN